MSVNTMDVMDAYTLVNAFHNQATGQTAIAPLNSADFISQATTALQVNKDLVYDQLMTTIGKTIFASRPYNAKFKGLEADEMRWGGIVRKISIGDKELEADKVYHDIRDGQSVDMYVRKKADVLETRFYGSDTYQDWVTIYRTQLFTAFSSPAQLGSFIAQQTTEMSNKWEQYRENFARLALANFIGAKNIADTSSVIHLLTEYNTLTGLSLTATDVYQPDNISGFFKFVRAKINTLARRMTERSNLYQVNITGHNIMRHTPVEDQRIYLSADALDIINTMVNADTYHDEPLKYAEVEGLSYWQSIETPNQIQVTPSYISSAGTVATGEAQTISNIFGVILDKDAVAYSMIDYSIDNTPLNARGKFWNTFLSSNVRYTNDLTEKGIVLLLD